MLIKADLATEITNYLEAGVMRHLKSSIFYSPLRYFHNRFKKNNPQTIDHARQIVQQDIEALLKEVPGFNPAIFVDMEHQATDTGKLFFKRIYNIGINLLKKRLTIRQAFKVMVYSGFRARVYNFILQSVKRTVADYVKKGQINNNQPELDNPI